jgi:TonB family protein
MIRLAWLFALALALSGAAQAQMDQSPASDDDPVYNFNTPSLRLPQMLKAGRPPEFTREARDAHRCGTVVLRILVGRDGEVSRAVVTRPLGFGLDESAVQHVKSWKLAPAILHHVAVSVETPAEVTFHCPPDWN